MAKSKELSELASILTSVADGTITFDAKLAGTDGSAPSDFVTKSQLDSAVQAQDNTDEITEGSTNLYYTDARAQSAITVNSTLSKTGGQISMPASGVTAGSYGSASAVPVFTVDAQGRITSASITNVAGVSGFSYAGATNTFTITTSAGTTFDASGDLSSFDTADLAESTNLYFTPSRARDSVSFAAGSGGYDATTGVITIPTNTDQLTNGAGFATTSYVDSAVAGKDNTDEITEGSSNLYFTSARAQGAISISGELLTYGSGVVGLTSEAIQDVVGAMVSSNSESAIAVTYNDAGNVLDFAVDTTTIATRTYVDGAIATLIDSAPGALDTLNELAAALGDDPNFASTITTQLTTKADKSTVITAGTGLTGGGDLSTGRTISHADTSSQVSVDNSGNTVIQDITLDGFGHITGLASKTIEYADVGAPSTTGTNASGTWGINVSGNAATATALQTARTINGVSFNGSANITVADNTKLPLTGGTLEGSLTYGSDTSGANLRQRAVGGWQDVLLVYRAGTLAWALQDTAGNAKVTSSNFYVNSNLALHAGNYNSYSPTLTGVGASGTWGINVTGNAATATILQTARLINGVSFNGSADVTVHTAGSGISISGTTVINTGVLAVTGTAHQVFINGGTATANGGITLSSNWTSRTDRSDGGDYNLTGRVSGNYAIAGVGTNGPGPSYLNLLHLTNGSDVAFQIAGGYVSDAMYFRGSYANHLGGGYSAWRTVLHNGNYNSYSPTLTGSGASGTWGINITGNAATATSANLIDGWEFSNTGSNAAVNADNLTSNGISYYGSGVPNFTGNGADGALYSQAYSSAWTHQIAGDYRSGQIALRGKNDGTWQAWRTVLDSGNYNIYSLPLSGGNMSGKIGRTAHNAGYFVGGHNNVGGSSSATNPIYTIGTDYLPAVTTLGDMYGIGYTHGTNASFVNLSGAAGWGQYVASDGDARVFLDAENGVVVSTGSHRAPIFYDSNDTGYYIDPNNTSDAALRMRGGALHGPNVTWGSYLLVGGDGRQNYTNSTSTASVCSTNGNLHIDSASGYTTHINWYDGGDIIFGAGDSSTTNAYLYNAGYLTVRSSVRSPLFYDSDDTGYYVDPSNGGFNLRGGSSNRVTYYTDDSGYKVYNSEGTGVTVRLGAAWERAGVYSSTSLDLGAESNIYLRIANSEKGYMDSSSNLFSYGSMRSPIFYDQNDTAYYVDPNSSSKVAKAQVNWGVASGTAGPALRVSKGWDGGIGNYIYDTVVVESNDVATIRVGELDGTQGGMCWGDGYNTYTSTHPMRFYTNGTAGTPVYSGMSGTLGLYVVDGSTRAPIYYDYNDTSYFVDPASSSLLRGRVDVTGGHGGSSFRTYLAANENGAQTGIITLQMWCSEPGNTWDGAGFGYNVDNNSNANSPVYYFGRPNPSIGQAYMRMTTNGYWYFYNTNTSGTRYNTMTLQSDGNATFGGSITASGNVTAYSDIRLKTDIVKISNALDKVLALGGYIYTRTDTGERQTGVIAQEVLEVLPEAVIGSEDTQYAVAYGNMVGLLIEAIKEQQEIIESQETRIARLEALVQQLIGD